MPALQKKHKKSSVHNIKSVMNTRYGPSDRDRTCGLMVPNHPRYQLRYTRLLSYFIRLVVFSQIKRDTNFAIPGYSISAMIPRRAVKIKFFRLWSFMWSKPLLCRFQQSGKVPQTQASQGFAAFRLALPRIPPRHSQTRRDTGFAIPGYARECG